MDRWLWFARFFKTRGLASKLVRSGHLRVNAHKITKPAHLVGAGDTLTFPTGRRVRVVRIVHPGTRRGPAPEAQALYEEIVPQEQVMAPDEAKRPAKARVGARPTKRERRQMERSRRDMLD